MLKKSSHVHKLKRHRFNSGNIVYFCALPDCKFKIATALALGKNCICWRCGDTFELNEYSIRLAKPHCDKCHKPKGFKPPEFDASAIGNPLPGQLEATSELEASEIEAITESIPEEIKTRINTEISQDSASDLRSRLFGITHSSLEAKPDDEDI